MGDNRSSPRASLERKIRPRKRPLMEIQPTKSANNLRGVIFPKRQRKRVKRDSKLSSHL